MGKLRKNTKNLRTDCAAVSSSGYTVSNGRIVSEQLNTKNIEKSVVSEFWKKPIIPVFSKRITVTGTRDLRVAAVWVWD
jgi:hypothetical protein